MSKDFTREEAETIFAMAYIAIGPHSGETPDRTWIEKYMDWRNAAFDDELEELYIDTKEGSLPTTHPLNVMNFRDWLARRNL